jgi:hypothetical protein
MMAAKLGALDPAGIFWRRANLIILPSALLALALLEPDRLSAWLPFPTSCGAVTGLPCIFCGATRALHYLLRGSFERALYFNWLSFPFFAASLLLLGVNSVELLTNRNVIARLPRVHFTPARCLIFGCGFVFLWVFQVYLALSQHKMELLNTHGPLYSLVCRWTP